MYGKGRSSAAAVMVLEVKIRFANQSGELLVSNVDVPGGVTAWREVIVVELKKAR
jgi:hypothetical protein